MKSMFDEATRAGIVARIDRVATGAKPRWGKMNAELMVGHLVESLRMALGEVTPKPKKMLTRHFPLKQIFVYWAPWPKGAPTARELLPKETGSLDAGRSELVRLLRLFAERAAQTHWPEHPAFGRLTSRAWGVLVYRHVDHHLRQFGV